MTIAEFLLKLACDRDLLARFNEDSEAVIRDFDLGDVQRTLLLSGNLRELRVKIKAYFELDGEIVCFETVYKPPPPPPPPPPDAGAD